MPDVIDPGRAMDDDARGIPVPLAGGYPNPAGMADGDMNDPARPVGQPVALAAVHACYAATGLPIVGMGGVTTGQDALELIACGARDVALGTVLFSDTDAPARVRAELAHAAEETGVASPDDVFARAHDVEKRPHTRRKVTA